MARKAAKTAVKAAGTKKKTGAAGGKKTGSGGSRKTGNKTASSGGRLIYGIFNREMEDFEIGPGKGQ